MSGRVMMSIVTRNIHQGKDELKATENILSPKENGMTSLNFCFERYWDGYNPQITGRK